MPLGLVGQPLLYTISIFASLGVFLFGYDQGVMSGIITGPYFKAFFHQPTRYELGTMVAILEIGAFITSIISGRIGDVFGRRKTLFIGAFVFTIGGLLQSLCTGFTSMVFGRVISGFGVGFLSTIVPIYQSEISPADHRGKLACMEFTGNVVGYAASVWLDYFSSFHRIRLVSPRWLLDTDQDRAGMRVLVDLNGGDPRNIKARQEYIEIKEAVLDDRIAPDRSYLAMWTRYRGRVLLAMSAQAFAQLNGINVIGYYAPLIFESAGWIGRDAILMTGINGTVYVFSTIPTFFGYSWGPIPWLYPPEIMPLPFRVKGVSISTATNWFFNYLVGEATPVLQDAIRWRLYPMHACFCVISFILEDMDELFGDVGLEDHENQSLVNSERSSIQRALEPPDLTLPPPLEEEDLTTTDGTNKPFGTSSWVDRVFKFGNIILVGIEIGSLIKLLLLMIIRFLIILLSSLIRIKKNSAIRHFLFYLSKPSKTMVT
ncbi:hypothetical protein PSHT_03400 [Puccinia striiformis]|uniref:Major facilitator superfamily (MFS) profile domain-containing protein n=1 Tax=Puccinia striiformis TaxID=27350 RepID=A0A2S4WFP2_9BASI|nr:hypothetical protein PSHT_03400 [Puccinia striiformis]